MRKPYLREEIERFSWCVLLLSVEVHFEAILSDGVRRGLSLVALVLTLYLVESATTWIFSRCGRLKPRLRASLISLWWYVKIAFRSILHGRDLLRGNLGKSRGNGQTTRLWKDSWISVDKLLKPMEPIKESALDLTVADPNFRAQIQCIKPSSTGTEDSFIWHQTASGIYSTKSGYFATNNPQQQIILARSERDFSWIRDIWAEKFSSKIKTFLWSIIHKAISLGSNLQKRGLASATLCVRCQETETEMHCFFICQYSKKVWELVPHSKAVHLAAGTNFSDVVVRFRKAICLPPSAIWTSRNTFIFERRHQTPEETTLKGIKLAREWSTSQALVRDKSDLPHNRPRESPQTISDSNRVTCKTDAAWNKEKLAAGLGWVFSGPRLESPIKGSMVESSIGSPLIAEASAISQPFAWRSPWSSPLLRCSPTT
ncbi:hypothetical protein IGI04_018933 [Brassica rapa subsp. trilocularis]|uniref:Reverse transcriptase zinc-binding domain-containing protein n=1 Tax=Brassica rapa subsp. trilocularis TaxID=1813537 RepID=A0ABQ7MED2_BRACM|nr:hypothetical protein IGI04_018933 [Brassica rapa subsp. trilocularis]